MYDDGDDLFSDEDERRPADSIFTINGIPIPFHLHNSLSSGGSRAIARKIEDAGGYPYATEEEARVIICRYGTPIFTELEFLYDHERYKWVEPPSWVDTCIDLGKYEHYLPTKTDKTKKWHNTRTPFSTEDDESLVQFLAHRIPFKDSGGRLGNGVYKDLCSDGRAPLYPWAKRHPWQSWRDRYSKNQDIFDPRIDYAVKHDPDPPKRGSKGQYVIPRKTRKPKPLQYNVEGEESDDDEYEEEERQDVPQQQMVRLQREEEEEEEEEDEVISASDINAKKRSRQESDLQDGPTERSRQSAPPPRKQPRIPVSPSESENTLSVGIGQDKGKGRGSRVPSELEFERPENMELNDVSFPAVYDDDGPGPSQSYKEPLAADVNTTMKASEVIVINRQQPDPHPNIIGVRMSEPPASAPKMPSDTQMTLVAPTHRRPGRNTAPFKTQATVVPSSRLHNPERAVRRGVSRKPAQQRSIAYNTRSRRRPEDELIQLDVSPLPDVKRSRGRPRSARASSLHGQLPYVSLQRKQASTSAANASLREEVQVEEILEVSQENTLESLAGRDGDRSSSGSLSFDDDEATRMLRDASQQMIKEGARFRPQPGRITAAGNVRNMPHIDISREASHPSRKPTVLRPFSTNAPRVDPDPDATPKAKPVNVRKAAKKTAVREPSDLHNSDLDLQSSIRTDVTGSSFPVETTNAREYLNAQSDFTPAPGTKAEEHIRSKGSRAAGKSLEARLM